MGMHTYTMPSGSIDKLIMIHLTDCTILNPYNHDIKFLEVSQSKTAPKQNQCQNLGKRMWFILQ